jgi:hypothetical protein
MTVVTVGVGEGGRRRFTMHSLLDIELAVALDNDRRAVRIGPTLRQLFHDQHRSTHQD